MKKTNKTKYAILGMLFDKPRSGYEIKQFMDESTTYFWQESDASIYPMLKTLHTEGMVTLRREFVGKRERKIFEITSAGKREFSRWLALPVEDETRRNEFLLKFFFSAYATTETIKNLLVSRQEKIKEIEAQFENIEKNVLPKISPKHPHKRFWKMALMYGLKGVRTEARWLIECCKALKITKKDFYGNKD